MSDNKKPSLEFQGPHTAVKRELAHRAGRLIMDIVTIGLWRLLRKL